MMKAEASQLYAHHATRLYKIIDVCGLQIDTPTDTPARDRFARYRGLKSWRSSPWDPREGLPQEYANTFAFENFKRAHKRLVITGHCLASPQQA